MKSFSYREIVIKTAVLLSIKRRLAGRITFGNARKCSGFRLVLGYQVRPSDVIVDCQNVNIAYLFGNFTLNSSFLTMPRVCSVHYCRSSVRKHGKTLFAFPKDDTIRAEWVRRVSSASGSARWALRAYSTVCSDHFTADCFIHDARLLHLGFQFCGRQLKPGSVPTLFHHDDDRTEVIIIIDEF